MPAAIRIATTAADIALAHALFEEYAAWLRVDLCFQGFAEELATLPGAYAPPAGRLLLAGEAGGAFGCIALRPLGATDGCTSCVQPADKETSRVSPPPTGEVKRLYVQPAARRDGWGLRLASAILDEGRAIGYRELKLDTLEWMTDARRLYAKLGFRECPPYYENPLPRVVYMALTL